MFTPPVLNIQFSYWTILEKVVELKTLWGHLSFVTVGLLVETIVLIPDIEDILFVFKLIRYISFVTGRHYILFPFLYEGSKVMLLPSWHIVKIMGWRISLLIEADVTLESDRVSCLYCSTFLVYLVYGRRHKSEVFQFSSRVCTPNLSEIIVFCSRFIVCGSLVYKI